MRIHPGQEIYDLVLKVGPPPSPTTTLFDLSNIYNPLNLKVLKLQYVNEIIVSYTYGPYTVPTASLLHPYGVPMVSLLCPYSIPTPTPHCPHSVPTPSLHRPYSPYKNPSNLPPPPMSPQRVAAARRSGASPRCVFSHTVPRRSLGRDGPQTVPRRSQRSLGDP